MWLQMGIRGDEKHSVQENPTCGQCLCKGQCKNENSGGIYEEEHKPVQTGFKHLYEWHCVDFAVSCALP